MEHMKYLEAVAAGDINHLKMKEATYKGSWKKRGGIGAWMMACRKFDRLEVMLSASSLHAYDIFHYIETDPSGADGSALAEVRDLRRYLLLVEAEMVVRGVVRCPEPDYIPVPRAPGFSDCQQPATRTDGAVRYDDDNSEGPNIQDLLPKPRDAPRTDSNRHAAQEYLMDGLKKSDYPAAVPYISVYGTDLGIVHRQNYHDNGRDSEIEHLPRLAVELNVKEHEDTLPEYRWLYNWSDGDGKFRMREAYRELWGKQ